MTFQETIAHHLRLSRELMRALSKRAGLGEKAVADIIHGKSRRPSVEALAALSDAIGADLLSIPAAPQDTYAELIAQLKAEPPQGWSPDRVADVTGKMGWFLRKQGWNAGPRPSCAARSSISTRRQQPNSA